MDVKSKAFGFCCFHLNPAPFTNFTVPVARKVLVDSGKVFVCVYDACTVSKLSVKVFNVAGISVAFTAAEMALAGVESRIPVDEVIDAMRRVGDSIPCALRETAQGGLATTPTGEALRKQVFGN